MPRFSANLSMLFTETPFLDRFALARSAGFEAVECQFPYDHPAADVASRLDGNGQTMVLHNLPAGDFAAGERGIAVLPERGQEFRDGVARAADYASRLRCPQLNCLVGKLPADADGERARAALVANIRFAADALAAAGIRLLLEMMNRFDAPGFALDTTAKALALLGEVGSGNVFLQYDVYHMQRAEGELARTIERELPRIAHIQVADNPGRHEPGTGEINYPFLFRHLDRIGYAGYVGCEYIPASTTAASLGWLDQARRA